MRPLLAGPDRKPRCPWGVSTPEYLRYHDEEWGLPTADDVRLFEKICLEGFQSGLSWLTILRKREAFRRAFAGFDLEKVARFGDCELRDEVGSLAAHLWRFEPDPASRPRRLTWAALREMSTTPESIALSRDLRRRGWTFVGPTTLYAFMQSVGIVNDHLDGCAFRARADRARRAFERPRVR